MLDAGGSAHPYDEDRGLASATERRGAGRDSLDGAVEFRCAATGERGRGVMVDVGEGGFCLLSPTAPAIGDQLCIEVRGFLIEARVCHLARPGVLWRIGVETR